MVRSSAVVPLVIAAWLGLSAESAAQTTATYHLHREASSTTDTFQLRTTGPDAAILAVTTTELQLQPAGEYVIKTFDTQAGVPGLGGLIPASSTVSADVWMRKTALLGDMVPLVKIFLNSASGTPLCTATGATTLTTSIVKYAVSCTTSTRGDALDRWPGTGGRRQRQPWRACPHAGAVGASRQSGRDCRRTAVRPSFVTDQRTPARRDRDAVRRHGSHWSVACRC